MKPIGRPQPNAKRDQPDRRKHLVVYWDTCVFLAWIKNEKRPAGDMDGINAIASQIMKGEVALITSSLTRAEIFRSRLTKPEREKFQKFLRRSNVYTLALDDRVADYVSELRDFYANTDFELLTPDAIHLATGIFYHADDFQTFDGSDSTRKPRDRTKRRCGLLLLDGSKVADKHEIRIRRPSAIQLDLLANLATAESLEIGGVEDPKTHKKITQPRAKIEALEVQGEEKQAKEAKSIG